MNQSEHDNQMAQIELKSPKISQLISALQAMKIEYGNVRVAAYDDDISGHLGESMRLIVEDNILIVDTGNQ